jgi:hypothetical protein
MKRPGKLRRPPQNTPRLYDTDGIGDPLDRKVFAHYFLPGTCCDWYVLEYSKDLDLMFGWAEIVSGGGELGYTSLKQIEKIVTKCAMSVNGMSGYLEVPVEYERNLGSVTLRDCLQSRAQVGYAMWTAG